MPSAVTCLWAYEQVRDTEELPATKFTARYKARACDIIPFLEAMVANLAPETLPDHHNAHTKRVRLPSGKVIEVRSV